ncbi:MAG TPA: hypothetical protein VG273_09010 [Bryobacteraceae bacterium]|jgi:hypothetical protein|nr:hypothetical protein [Bryobacteraceae bacterium]
MKPLRILTLVALLSGVGLAQHNVQVPVAPMPSDPLEPVNGGIVIPATPDQRLAAQQIIVKARDQYKLHAGGPFDLKLTFNATGRSRYEGPGTLEELSLGMNGSRWTAQLGSYSQTRIVGTMGLIYDDKPAGEIPMRLQQLREAVFSPIYASPQNAFIRTATVIVNNEELNCVLLTHSSGEPPTVQRRRWSETEWCVNAQSGLLRIASEAPGTYTTYDYTDSLHFHDYILPRNIKVSEGGTSVLDIRLESVTDPASLDRQQLTPAAGMKSGPVLQDAVHLFEPVFSNLNARPTVIRQVVVHATFGANGRVIESELAEASDPTLETAALDFASRYNYAVPTPPGAITRQSQVYLHINFFQAR